MRFRHADDLGYLLQRYGPYSFPRKFLNYNIESEAYPITPGAAYVWDRYKLPARLDCA
jgi:hypothetical protein